MHTTRLTLIALLLALLAGVGCKNHVVYRERGFDDFKADDFAAAAENFRLAIDKKPSDFQSQYYLGLSLLEEDQPVSAQAPLEQALALRPDDPKWTPRIIDALAESYYEQERYETLYAFLDDTIATYRQQSYDFLRKAKYLGLLGDADGQKTALEKAGYFAPAGDAGPYLALADFYLGVNDVPNAIQALRYGYHEEPANERVKNALRGLGVVPGPTIADAPPKPVLTGEDPFK
ncbi:MAG: hypothetical protein AAF333_11490 [Planctomycetota bacterium]